MEVGVVPVLETGDDGRHVRKQLEVDFVANSGSRHYYIQSAVEIGTVEKMEQEQHPFRKIDDSFRKILIRKDSVKPWHNDNGVLIISIFDFLLHPESIDW